MTSKTRTLILDADDESYAQILAVLGNSDQVSVRHALDMDLHWKVTSIPLAREVAFDYVWENAEKNSTGEYEDDEIIDAVAERQNHAHATVSADVERLILELEPERGQSIVSRVREAIVHERKNRHEILLNEGN